VRVVILKNGKKLGFTLAEILITLGIIGVVAAMTIPALFQKYNERVTVNKVKKFYSLVSQAVLSAISENGPVPDWEIGEISSDDSNSYVQANKNFISYLKPHLKVMQDCGAQTGCLGYSENVNRLSGGKHSRNYETDPTYYKMILADGSTVVIKAVSNSCKHQESGVDDICATVLIDINGGKKPNTGGII